MQRLTAAGDFGLSCSDLYEEPIGGQQFMTRDGEEIWLKVTTSLIVKTSLLLLHLAALMHVTFAVHHEFVYVPTLVNWTNAQKYCREHYTDLATIDDQADHDELLKTGGMWKFWIGLSRTTVTGVFVWSDQSSSSFRKWRSGQPNGQLCVNVEIGEWFDRNCVDNVAFACYFDRKREIVRLEVKSSLNLNDPAVMNEILMNMEHRLKQKGLSQHAKLSWRTQSNGNVFQKKDLKIDATKQTCV
ncbi:hypothetical protein Q8A67_001627 [Cirrhinus molitorella]|uniref:C-type lectin domain-containing protein n=1 Tax=Cirrhinus molitorella TaxID=172907 RepID=A0AA88Q288_9TELE|nr:hypothetical protein Q8A67_001627 [Cirrhinus molitorella]